MVLMNSKTVAVSILVYSSSNMLFKNIVSVQSSMKLFSSRFGNNITLDNFTASNMDLPSYDSGVVLNIASSDILLKNSVFRENYVDNKAGVIIIGNYERPIARTLTIENCTFMNNSAVNGGVIFSYWTAIKISNSIFIGN